MLTMMIDEQKIRHDCVLFLARKGYGALTDLANAAGLSAESVRRVRQGTKVDLDTLVAVRDAMQKMGWSGEQEVKPAPRANDPTEPYVPAHPVEQLLARKFVNIADDIAGKHLKAPEKVKALVNFHKDLSDLLPAYLREIEKRTVEGN